METLFREEGKPFFVFCSLPHDYFFICFFFWLLKSPKVKTLMAQFSDETAHSRWFIVGFKKSFFEIWDWIASINFNDSIASKRAQQTLTETIKVLCVCKIDTLTLFNLSDGKRNVLFNKILEKSNDSLLNSISSRWISFHYFPSPLTRESGTTSTTRARQSHFDFFSDVFLIKSISTSVYWNSSSRANEKGNNGTGGWLIETLESINWPECLQWCLQYEKSRRKRASKSKQLH